MQNSDSFVQVQVWADLMKSSKHSRNIFQSYIILQPPTFDLSPSYISFVLVNTIYIFRPENPRRDNCSIHLGLPLAKVDRMSTMQHESVAHFGDK